MITIRKTSDTDIARELRNSNGAVVNLTGASFSCDLRETPTSNAIVSITPTTISASYGLYKIPIASSILTNLSKRTYYCRVAITIGTADYDNSFYLKILDNTGVSISAGHATSGTTANRPTLTSTDVGFTYYDTTLGKLIVWTGSAWDINVEGGTNFLGAFTTAVRLGMGEGLSAGDWVFDTDLNSPYYWNGSEWV